MKIAQGLLVKVEGGYLVHKFSRNDIEVGNYVLNLDGSFNVSYSAQTLLNRTDNYAEIAIYVLYTYKRAEGIGISYLGLGDYYDYVGVNNGDNEYIGIRKGQINLNNQQIQLYSPGWSYAAKVNLNIEVRINFPKNNTSLIKGNPQIIEPPGEALSITLFGLHNNEFIGQQIDTKLSTTATTGSIAPVNALGYMRIQGSDGKWYKIRVYGD